MTLIRIRPADVRDKDALKSLLDLSWLTHWAPHVHAASVVRYRGERPAHGYVDSRWQNFVVAERDGVVLGMFDLDASYLHAIHVHPEAIGSGLGKALMDHAEENGAAVLDVRVFNRNAIDFYQHRGWQKTEECDAIRDGYADSIDHYGAAPKRVWLTKPFSWERRAGSRILLQRGDANGCFQGKFYGSLAA